MLNNFFFFGGCDPARTIDISYKIIIITAIHYYVRAPYTTDVSITLLGVDPTVSMAARTRASSRPFPTRVFSLSVLPEVLSCLSPNKVSNFVGRYFNLPLPPSLAPPLCWNWRGTYLPRRAIPIHSTPFANSSARPREIVFQKKDYRDSLQNKKTPCVSQVTVTRSINEARAYRGSNGPLGTARHEPIKACPLTKQAAPCPLMD